jgi:O-antigen/teichoic acid export membrane protein
MLTRPGNKRYNNFEMKITYETALATRLQFILISFLGIPNALNSIITTCKDSHSDCFANTFLSLIYFILIVAWFGFLWILGFAAQDRRSKRLALLLIACEGLVLLVSLFNARHHNDILGLLTSIIDGVLAAWIILLAWRLQKAGGGRVVAKQRGRSGRARQRRRPTDDQE